MERPALTMQYREIAPHTALEPWVHCFWFLRTGPGAIEPVVPDGRMEIVIHRRDPFWERDDRDRLRAQASVLVSGQLTRPAWVGPLAPADVVGIRLRTAGARDVLRDRVDTLTDRIVGLGEVHPRLAARLRDAAHAHDPVVALSAVLYGHLNQDKGVRPSHAMSRPAVTLIERGLDIGRVARQLGCSSRTLERHLKADVGLAPKALQRVLRFRRFYALLEQGHNGSRAALDAGYYDHSHANRDFREFAGVAPGIHFGRDPSLAPLFLGTQPGPGHGTEGHAPDG